MVVLSNLLVPQEGIQHEEPNTTVYVKTGKIKEVGKGTLYITESVLSWVNSTTQQGFSLAYPSITLHGVATNEQILHRDCLYVHINVKVDLPDSDEIEKDDNSDNENGGEDDDSDTIMTEMMFAPDNTHNLQAMFKAMSTCQTLHPDPDDSFSDDNFEECEEEEDYLENNAEGEDSYISHPDAMIGNQNGNESDEAMDCVDGQYEDAESDL